MHGSEESTCDVVGTSLRHHNESAPGGLSPPRYAPGLLSALLLRHWLITHHIPSRLLFQVGEVVLRHLQKHIHE